jgi:uridine kinase
MELRSVLEAIRSSRAPGAVKVRVIAIDGLGGAGKSSLAALLARELDAPIVRTDDFAHWDNPTDWWPDQLAHALEPLAAGKPAWYEPTSWDAEEKAPVMIEPAEFVILEGVTASREAFRPYLACSVWVETPREVRLRRGLERDGPEARSQWEEWMEAEDRYVERERPAEHSDCVLRGDQDWWGRRDPR